MSEQQTNRTELLEQDPTVVLEIDKYIEDEMVENELERTIKDESEQDETEKKSENDTIVLSSAMTDYMKQIAQYEVLPVEQELELFKQLEKGDRDAYEMLFNHNLKLVISIAKHYFNVLVGLEPLDIVMEGNLGLSTAIFRFDYRKGYKFSTYATWWIKQSITRAISNTNSLIRIPVHAHESLYRYRKYMNRIENEDLPVPSISRIAKDLKLTEDQVALCQNIHANLLNPGSLNKTVNPDEDNDSEMIEFMDTGQSIEDDYMNKDLRDSLLKMLDKWIEKYPGKNPERQRDIIMRRFGLHNGVPETLEEVGNSYGITRERVRQIEEKFIRYARHPKNKRELQAYYDN